MIIFIIPHHRIGGAEKVHSEIIKSVASHKRIIVIFEYTDGSPISHGFKKYPHIILDNSRIRKLLCLVLITLLSRVLPLTIFGCNSPFFYRLLSKVSPRTTRIDLTHAFSYPDRGSEDYSRHYVSLISKRIVINHRTLEDYRNQYLKEGINLSYMQRFQVIPNGVYIYNFDDRLIEERFKNFTIGYVGRFAREKRPELFLEITRLSYKFECKGKMITDRFDGEVASYPGLNVVLDMTDPLQIRKEFSTISVLIIASEREGFPLTVMESMELGIPVISTNVGSIHEHVVNGFTGYISDTNDNEPFLTFCHQKIGLLGSNQKLYTELCLNARRHAVEHFNIDKMHRAYRELFLNE
ncbi:MAG: glycosyltransferase [Bacteroidetes bacterium]|nr:MAG: glycosyltransferase [Bacteroidota bacterium]